MGKKHRLFLDERGLLIGRDGTTREEIENALYQAASSSPFLKEIFEKVAVRMSIDKIDDLLEGRKKNNSKEKPRRGAIGSLADS